MLATDKKVCDNSTTSGTGTVKEACINVRYADETDLPTVLGMYLAALNEINDKTVTVSPEKCAKTVLFSWATAPCVLLEKMGQIVGFAGLQTNKPQHSDDNIITEYMFYIKPEHRSAKAAMTLSDAVKSVADTFGIPLFFTHRLGGVDCHTKEKFLKRWGYNPWAISCTYGGRK